MTGSSLGPLGPLPADWRIMPLGKVVERTSTPVEVKPTAMYREIGIRSHGKGVFHKEPVKGSALGAKRVFKVEPDRLVFNIVFAWEGAVAVTSQNESDMIASHRFPMFAPTADRLVDLEFLRRFFQSKLGVRLLGDASPGGAGRNRTLNQKFTAEIPVPVPPLAEQNKIAIILSSVDHAIAATQAVIDQLQLVKKVMMGELLTRGLPGRHTRFKMTENGEVPERWSVVPVGQVFEVQLGKMMSADARSGPSQLPYLRNENVYWHRLDLSDVSTMAFDERERAKFRLRTGDLLACEGRHIGRCAVWNDELDECYYQKALHRLRPTSDAVTTGYMKFFMALRFRYQSDLVAEANATSTIPHLPRKKLVALPMWFPPREEQEEIVELLDTLLSREAANEAVRNRLTGLRSALMSALLSGEVRVKPDSEAA